MRTLKKQRGISVISVLLLLGFLGIASTLFVRLLPVYMDYYGVRSVMNEVAHSPGIGSKSLQEVWDSMSTRLTINNIGGVTQNSLSMKTLGNETTLTVKYHVKKHLIANIDGLIYFDYSVHYKSTLGQ